MVLASLLLACMTGAAVAQDLREIVVTPVDRSIDVNQSKSMTATATFADGDLTFTEEVTDRVVWTSSNPAVVFVSNEPGSRGHAFGVSPGVVFISARLDGVSSSDSGGDAVVRVPAALVRIEISPTTVQLPVGFTQELRATGFLNDGSAVNITDDVDWISSNRSKVLVSDAGEITARDDGVAVISAVDPDTRLSSSEFDADAVVTVTGRVVGLVVTPEEQDLTVGASRRFNVRVILDSGPSLELPRRSVEWRSSNPEVAPVSNDPSTAGLVTAEAAGETIISAFHPPTEIAGGAALVRVLGELVSVRVTPSDRRIDLGDEKSMTALGTFSGGGGFESDVTDEVTWRTSDPSVVFVSNQPGRRGRATAVGVGEATISVTAENGVSTFDNEGHARIRVPASLESVRIVPNDIDLAIDFSRALEARGTFSDGSVEDISNDVLWSSTDRSVAVVSNVAGREGEVTAVDDGVTVISVVDRATGLSSSASGGDAVVFVAGRVVSLRVSPATEILPIGLTERFSVSARLDDGSRFNVSRSSVEWISSNPAVATVSNNTSAAGLVSAQREGSTVVSVEHAPSGLNSSSSGTNALVTVPGVIVGLRVVSDTEDLIAGETLEFEAEAEFDDGTFGFVTDLVDWDTSNDSVATVRNDGRNKGEVTAVDNGQATIAITDPATGVTSTRTGGDAEIRVRQLISLQVTPADRRIDLHEEKSMTATGTLTGGATRDLTDIAVWTSSNPAVVSVSNERGRRGKATARGPGVAFISATGPGGVSSSDSNGDARVRVDAELASIRIVPGRLRLPAGFTGTLEAEGRFTDGSVSDISNDVTWFSSNPFIVEVSNGPGTEGDVTALGQGIAVISAEDPSGISSTASNGDAEVEVAGRVTGIEVTPRTVSIPVGLTRRFSARARLDDGSTFGLPRRSIDWITGNPAIAIIGNEPDNAGTLTALVRGQTTVSAFHADSGILSAETGDDAVVTVPGRLVGIEVRPEERELFIGQTKGFSTFGILDQGGDVKLSSDIVFSSNNAAIATVSNDSGERGATTAVAEGTTTISALHVPSGLSSSGARDATVIVTGRVVSLRVDPRRAFYLSGTEEKIKLQAMLTNGRETNVASDVIWTSSDPSVAEVGNESPKKGVLIAKSFGTVTISAVEPASGVTTDATNGNGVVTVIEEVERLRVLDAALELRTGDRPRLRGIGRFTNPDPLEGESEIVNFDLSNRVVFTSSNPAAVRIEGDRALAVGLGEAVISAEDPELDISSTTTGGDALYRVFARLERLKIKPRKIRLRLGSDKEKAFSVIGRYSDGARLNVTDQVTFLTKDPAIAEIGNSSSTRGVVFPLSRGRTRVTVTDPVTGVRERKARRIIVRKAKR